MALHKTSENPTHGSEWIVQILSTNSQTISSAAAKYLLALALTHKRKEL